MHTLSPTHTPYLFQSQTPVCNNLIWFASKQEKRRLWEEELGLWSLRNQCIPAAFEHSLCQMLLFRNDEEQRVNRLIEILSKGMDRKRSRPSVMLPRRKYVATKFPLQEVLFKMSPLSDGALLFYLCWYGEVFRKRSAMRPNSEQTLHSQQGQPGHFRASSTKCQSQLKFTPKSDSAQFRV